MTVIISFLLTSCAMLPPEIQRMLANITPQMQLQQVYVGDPVFIRIFKEDNILELWMKPENSYQYKLIKTYPICKWSGRLGPKFREGDLQSPEGFYYTNRQSLNPNSRYHLSFNLNFPNDYDRAYGRTGTFLMIHGDCVSEGCYAMTDPLMEEIYILTERALKAGHYEIPVHIFPFRMTSDRMARARLSPHYDFWRNLKQGYDYFKRYRVPPNWDVINGEYVFY